MSYGVVPTGFNRKPLAVILSEIEGSLITEFGPHVVQTSQSPLGQINGLMADLITTLWEFAEDTYQSYDPDQAEGVRLDTLGKIRLLRRSGLEGDVAFRRAITNQGRARIDLQDITRAVRGLAGVTYAQVWINDSVEGFDQNGMPRGTITVAVLGGDDEEIAEAMRRFIVPGISTHGNVAVTTVDEGFCRQLMILRPILVPVTLDVRIRTSLDANGCPPPAPIAIRDALIADFEFDGPRMLLNGDDVTHYRVRAAIESRFPGVEVIEIVASRDGLTSQNKADIGFIEIAVLSPDTTTVTVL